MSCHDKTDRLQHEWSSTYCQLFPSRSGINRLVFECSAKQKHMFGWHLAQVPQLSFQQSGWCWCCHLNKTAQRVMMYLTFLQKHPPQTHTEYSY